MQLTLCHIPTVMVWCPLLSRIQEPEPEPEEESEPDKHFPVIQGWLEKRNGSYPNNLRNRWVVVKGSWFLWNDIEHECGDPNDPEERYHFSKCFSLLKVDSVDRVDSGKEKRRFKIVVSIGDKKKEYIWRTESEEKRNRWVMELKYRIEYYKSKVDVMSSDVAEIY